MPKTTKSNIERYLIGFLLFSIKIIFKVFFKNRKARARKYFSRLYYVSPHGMVVLWGLYYVSPRFTWGYYSSSLSGLFSVIFLMKCPQKIFTIHNLKFTIYFSPVLPKPFSPRAVSSKTATSNHSTFVYCATMSCARRSPSSITKSSLDKFIIPSLISPI